MNKFLFVLAAIAIAAAVLLPVGECSAQEYAMVTEDAIILDMENDVDVKIGANKRWINAKVGMALPGGTQIKTGPDSWAEIGLEIAIGNENVIRVESDSTMTLAQVRPTRLELLNGKLRSLVQGIDWGSTFEVKTPVAVCGARGTGWDTGTDGKKLTVDTYEENVFMNPLSAGVAKTIIKAGKRGIMKGPKNGIIVDDLPEGKMHEWNKWKEDMSRRTGVKVGIKGKVSKTIKNIKDVIKTREKILDRKDMDSIKDRLDDKTDRSEPRYGEGV
jgi:hypothetical protein